MSTIQKTFDVELPAALKSKKSLVTMQISTTFHLQISGEGGGEWFINCADEPGCSRQKLRGDADLTISGSADSFQMLLDQSATADKLVSSGRLKVTGNQMLIGQLQKLLALTR